MGHAGIEVLADRLEIATDIHPLDIGAPRELVVHLADRRDAVDALGLQALTKGDEHQAVEHRHAEQRDEADAGRDREREVAQPQAEDAADDRERDI